MDFTQLYYFQMTVKYGSMNAAAKKLYISQPAISKQIRNLENELGILLFNRNNKNLILTEAGKRILLHTDCIMQECDSIKKFAVNYQTDDCLTINVSYMVASVLLFDMISKFRTTHPEIKIISKRSNSLDVNTDFIFHATYTGDIRKNSHILFKEEICLVIPRNHKALHDGYVNLKDLQNENFLTREMHDAHTKDLQYFCSLAGFSPKIVSGYDTSQIRIGGVTIGDGLALIPTSSNHITPSDAVCFAHAKDVDCSRYLRITHPHGTLMNSNAKKFYRFMINMFEII